MKRKRPALGRGLDALMPPPRPEPPPPQAPAPPDAPGLRRLPIEQLRPNPDQPRRDFGRERLEGLAASIGAHGIVQPIIVTPPEDQSEQYVIVAGERRWRAAQIAGLHDVPVVVRDTPAQDRLEIAVIENLQRQDLNPIEEAHAFQQLIDIRDYTQEQLAGRLGKDRSTVANALRLLRLPDKVQDLLRANKLQMGHARALLGLEHEADMIDLARRAVRQRLSVRAMERAVRELIRPPAVEADDEAARRKVIVAELEGRLRRRLGARVRLRTKKGRKGAGTVEIPYSSLDELDRILRTILDGPGE
jgi:ParB family chromosome partitioning protein